MSDPQDSLSTINIKRTFTFDPESQCRCGGPGYCDCPEYFKAYIITINGNRTEHKNMYVIHRKQKNDTVLVGEEIIGENRIISITLPESIVWPSDQIRRTDDPYFDLDGYEEDITFYMPTSVTEKINPLTPLLVIMSYVNPVPEDYGMEGQKKRKKQVTSKKSTKSKRSKHSKKSKRSNRNNKIKCKNSNGKIKRSY